jgi:hypothetical protein
MGVTSMTGQPAGSFDVAFSLSDTDAPPIPEPATMLLVGTGALVSALRARKRQPLRDQ